MNTIVFIALALFATLTLAQKCKQISGSGASFPEQFYAKCFPTSKNPKVMYSSVGSSQGVEDFVMKKTSFGASDSPPKLPGTIVIPTVGGGIVVSYNLGKCRAPVNLMQKEVVAIFFGKQTVIDACMKQCKKITVVIRKDGSGTTKVFTEALRAFDPKMVPQRFVDKEPKWPKALKPVLKDGNSGIAEYIKKTKCTVGYVGYSSARKNKLKMAAIENKMKIGGKTQFVKPTIKTIRAGLAGVKVSVVQHHFPPYHNQTNKYQLPLTFLFFLVKPENKSPGWKGGQP